MALLRVMMVTLAAILAGASFASAQPLDLGPATGKVPIPQLQVAFIGSGAIGGGTLNYRGKSYGITVGGLGIAVLVPPACRRHAPFMG